MKKFYVLLLIVIPSYSFSQTVFWTEDFGAGCNQGQLATAATGSNGPWTVTETGFNAEAANAWFISASENGNAIGQCGSGCGNNRTLHISNNFTNTIVPTLDTRAWYLVADGLDALCGIIPGVNCAATDKRVESPTINCSGRSNISVNFQYIEGGVVLDNASLWYSANNGGAWSQLSDMPKTPFCNTDYGIWTAYTFALPASADNNPNVKIAFRWINNDDADWHDPSIAIDNITLSVPADDCCPGDFNCDGVVNVLDMIIIVNQFGCGSGCTADLDNDGIIGAADLTIFNGLYGDICP